MSSIRNLAVPDAHAHPTDSLDRSARFLLGPGPGLGPSQTSPGGPGGPIAAMSSSRPSIPLVAALADAFPGRITPAFGLHPWFSHEVSTAGFDPAAFSLADLAGPARSGTKLDHYRSVLYPDIGDSAAAAGDAAVLAQLPDPAHIADLLRDVAGRLDSFPGAVVGEVGLDRGFRVKLPDAGDSGGGGDGSTGALTRFRVRLPHQRAVLAAQLRLAAFYNRPVSAHCVGAVGLVMDAVLDVCRSGLGRSAPQPTLLRVCLHSFPGTDQAVHPFLRAECDLRSGRAANSAQADGAVVPKFYFSFSIAVNWNRWAKAAGGAGLGFPENVEELQEQDVPVAFADVVRAVPADRLLVETDLPEIGSEWELALERIVWAVFLSRRWLGRKRKDGSGGSGGWESIEDCATQLKHNWQEFQTGEQIGI